MARLTEAQVRKYRRLVRTRVATAAGCARMARVKVRTMQHAVRGGSWKHLPGAVPFDGRNRWLRGQRSPNHRLTEAQVHEIRALVDVPRTDVARAYGVSTRTVQLVQERKAWAWLPERDVAA